METSKSMPINIPWLKNERRRSMSYPTPPDLKELILLYKFKKKKL